MKHTVIAGCAALAAALSLASCSPTVEDVKQKVYPLAASQLRLMDARLAPDATPRTFEPGTGAVDRGIRWWCSGFMPGSLWYLYEATADPEIKALAEKQTLKLANILDLKTDHDIGFQVNCSYGNAYRITRDSSYLPLIEASAARLATRFNPTVGCIKSWDNSQYSYSVIIDNMMNLELLLNASELFGCDSLRQIALTHANTTMKNHYRPDYSCYHLVDYSPETGEIILRRTVQGYADETAWSRGQAWGLYGYTMMYEKTGDEAYLKMAENIAGYLIPRLPKDGIPYWDFNAPGTPDAIAADAPGCPSDYRWKEGEPVLRDASAGAIMASAFISLSRLTKDKALSKKCLNVARTQIITLGSDEYLSKPGENGGFLLLHSVGNLHGNSEVDVPLTYADYYFLEALAKYSE